MTYLYPRFEEEGVYFFCSVFPLVLPSVPPSLSNIFNHTFLSNHASKPVQTLYGASARSPTCRLPNSRLPVIHFLFFDVVYFLT